VTAGRDATRPSRANILVRSVLTSVALLMLWIPAAAAAGGYFPRAPVISGYGRLLVSDLPWLVLGAALAVALAILALRLGGKRFTALLAGASLIVLAGLAVVWIQYAALAASHGAAYDFLREARTPTPLGRGPDERVVFAEVEGQPLHAEVWRAAKPAPTADPNALRPGVLYIHGGAFNHGSPGIRPHLFAAFADDGYAVADIEYRLAPPPRWSDAPADVLCALGWFQDVAPTYGIDPNLIVVMGDSAGGNLALIAAYEPGSAGQMTASCDVVPRAAAGVIALYPTAELAATWADVREISDETPFPEMYIGGTPSQFPDRYDEASVQHLIRTGLPPMLLVTGTNDLIVRVERMRDLAARVRAAGSAAELVEVPFAEHAFDGPPNGYGMQLEEALLPAFIESLRGGQPTAAMNDVNFSASSIE
jgi:acetyl esterase/lipase